MSKVGLLAAAIALLGLARAGRAENASPEPGGHVGLVGEFALELGGDSVNTVLFSDGSTQDVRAGQGGTLALGGHYRAAGSSFDLVTTVGFKFVTTKATNASIGINRGVLQALALYDPSASLWIGAGPVLHFANSFDAGGLGDDIAFDPAFGLTLQTGWRWLGASYTLMKYQGGGRVYDANAFGVWFRWRG